MRMSEAMRLGSMQWAQARGQFSELRKRFRFFGPKVQRFCALGTAYQAATGGRFVIATATEEQKSFRGVIKAGEQVAVMDTPSEWLKLLRVYTLCPACSQCDQVRQLIPHLNDEHRWTREQIATWLEPIELAQEAPRVLETIEVETRTA